MMKYLLTLVSITVLAATTENANEDVVQTETNHLAKVYKDKSAGEVSDLIKIFAPDNGAQLANTSKDFRLEDLRNFMKILEKHGVGDVKIIEAPMPALVINGVPFKSLPESALLEILGKLGDTVAQINLCTLYKLENNSAQLQTLANQGWKKAQDFVAQGYAWGQNGFAPNPNELQTLANQGWERAQTYVALGYAWGRCGRYEFDQDPNQLLALASQGWVAAVLYIAEGYAWGQNGFDQDPNQLLALANQGWEKVQVLVAHGYAEGKYGFTQNRIQLLALANQGWEKAQELVALGYAEGKYGFTQNLIQLLALANQGWEKAQALVALGYAEGKYGFTQNLIQLLALANQGWEKAQALVALGYAEGQNGFAKDQNALRELAIKFRKHEGVFTTYANTLSLKERIMFRLYIRSLDQHEQLIG